MLRNIVSRGHDATGTGWWDRDGINPWYSKLPGPATRTAHRLALPNKGITTLIGHTRHLTIGPASDEDNNHPVVAGNIVCTHNGRVENHEELIELSGLDRIGEVDSWAFPALLSQQEELGADHPKELLELFEGVASVAWLDASEPDVLHLARLSTRPLTIGWTRRGDLVYSSTRKTLTDGAKAARTRVDSIISVPEGTYMRIRDGVFEEWSEFKVRGPRKVVPDDRPGAKTVHLPMSGVTSYDPDVVVYDDPIGYDEWAARQDESDARLFDDGFVPHNMHGMDTWESQIDTSGIDWDSLVPRRGWSKK